MGQTLGTCTAGDGGSCKPNDSVVLPQTPITVNDDALKELKKCINNYIYKKPCRPCRPDQIRDLIRETGMNPAGILRDLEKKNVRTYKIAAYYTSISDRFRDEQKKYNERCVEAAREVSRRNVSDSDAAAKLAVQFDCVFQEQLDKDQITINKLYKYGQGLEWRNIDGEQKWRQNNWRHEGSFRDKSRWYIGEGYEYAALMERDRLAQYTHPINQHYGGGSKKPRRETKKKKTQQKKKTQRKKRTQRKKKTQRNKKTKSTKTL